MPRVYMYNEQDGLKMVTENQILADYYPWWCEEMRKAGKADKISPQNCIDDFCVVHWAWEVKPTSISKDYK